METAMTAAAAPAPAPAQGSTTRREQRRGPRDERAGQGPARLTRTRKGLAARAHAAQNTRHAGSPRKICGRAQSPSRIPVALTLRTAAPGLSAKRATQRGSERVAAAAGTGHRRGGGMPAHARPTPRTYARTHDGALVPTPYGRRTTRAPRGTQPPSTEGGPAAVAAENEDGGGSPMLRRRKRMRKTLSTG